MSLLRTVWKANSNGSPFLYIFFAECAKSGLIAAWSNRQQAKSVSRFRGSQPQLGNTDRKSGTDSR
jgi:hypothetical protein